MGRSGHYQRRRGILDHLLSGGDVRERGVEVSHLLPFEVGEGVARVVEARRAYDERRGEHGRAGCGVRPHDRLVDPSSR